MYARNSVRSLCARAHTRNVIISRKITNPNNGQSHIVVGKHLTLKLVRSLSIAYGWDFQLCHFAQYFVFFRFAVELFPYAFSSIFLSNLWTSYMCTYYILRQFVHIIHTALAAFQPLFVVIVITDDFAWARARCMCVCAHTIQGICDFDPTLAHPSRSPFLSLVPLDLSPYTCSYAIHSKTIQSNERLFGTSRSLCLRETCNYSNSLFIFHSSIFNVHTKVSLGPYIRIGRTFSSFDAFHIHTFGHFRRRCAGNMANETIRPSHTCKHIRH